MLTVLGMVLPATSAAAQPFVYVLGRTPSGPQFVTVIDPATGAKVARIAAGIGNAGSSSPGLAISRDGSLLFVANTVSSTVSVISTATNAVVATIPEAVVGFEPSGVVVSPDNTRLYVVRSGSGVVREVDLATRQLARSVSLGVTGILGMEVAPDGSRVYVSNTSTHSIKVVDTSTFTVTSTIALGAGTFPGSVAVSPDGLRVYVTLFNASIAVVDSTSGGIVTTVPVGRSPQGVSVSRTGTFAYVTAIDNVSGVDTVSRVSTATNTVTATTSGVRGGGVSFTADNAAAWVVGVDRVYQLSTVSNGVVGTPVVLDLAVEGAGREVVTTPPPFTPPIAITTTTLPGGTVGAAYAATLAATGGAGALSWTIDGGTLPSGLTLATTGVISGTPTAAGTANFTVRVVDAASSSATRALSIVVNGPAGNPAPVLAPGVVNRPNLTLTWTPPTSGPAPTAYTLVASLSAAGPVIAQLPLGLQTSVTVAAPDGTFFVRILATVNGAAVSSNEVRVDIAPPAVPSAPLAVTASVSGSVITFAWQPPTGGTVSGYLLEAGTGPGLTNLASLPVGNVTTFITPAVPNGSYFVRVRAQNMSGTGPASNEVRAVVGPPPPGAPTLAGSGGPGGNVSLSWSVPTSGAAVTGYEVHAGTAPGLSNVAVIPLPASQTTLGAGGVPPGTYYVRVVATSASGPGAFSNELALVVP